MATFVLVHGAWHGGWCWKKVTPLLRAAGHEVFTPTLTGLGERAHLLSPEIDLSLHIRDVVNVLEYEDLHGVVLVGHSYAGMVITGVASQVPGRLAHLVYLDAAVPRDRESRLELVDDDLRASVEERVRTRGDGWKIPVTESNLDNWRITDPSDRAWVWPRLAPHPFETYREIIRLGEAAIEGIPRTFIRCTAPVSASATPSVERVLEETGWRYRDLATGHDAMVTMPGELADLLLEI
jgi:pimeloyl-ACP methyl ester carboxylesterase